MDVLVDLDGTLIDTAPDLIDSLNHALTPEGFDAVDRVLVGAQVGMGGRAMIERVFTINQRRVDPDIVERHHAVFVAHYTAGIPGRSRPYPGVLDNVPAARGYSGGFGADLMLKDLTLVTDAAKSAKQPVMLGALAQQIYQKHSADGHGGKDFSSVILQYRKA